VPLLHRYGTAAGQGICLATAGDVALQVGDHKEQLSEQGRLTLAGGRLSYAGAVSLVLPLSTVVSCEKSSSLFGRNPKITVTLREPALVLRFLFAKSSPCEAFMDSLDAAVKAERGDTPAEPAAAAAGAAPPTDEGFLVSEEDLVAGAGLEGIQCEALCVVLGDSVQVFTLRDSARVRRTEMRQPVLAAAVATAGSTLLVLTVLSV
jgi:hypothetical protein